MRPKQFSIHATQAPVPDRVFPEVAHTPGAPAPRWWNHPVTVMYAAVLAAAGCFAGSGLPAVVGVLVAMAGIGLAATAELHRRRWSADRARALGEAVWAAAQSGYRVEVFGEELHWTDGAGQRRGAALEHRAGGWHLVLHGTGAPAADDGA